MLKYSNISLVILDEYACGIFRGKIKKPRYAIVKLALHQNWDPVLAYRWLATEDLQASNGKILNTANQISGDSHGKENHDKTEENHDSRSDELDKHAEISDEGSEIGSGTAKIREEKTKSGPE